MTGCSGSEPLRGEKKSGPVSTTQTSSVSLPPLPPSLSFILGALVQLMSHVCACWIAASACTPEGPRGFQSCVATPAVPPHRSPSSLPRSHSFSLQGRNKQTSKHLFKFAGTTPAVEPRGDKRSLGTALTL